MGLFGQPFAVGWVVVDHENKEYSSGLLSTPLPVASGFNSAKEAKETKQWIQKHVVPALPNAPNCSSLSGLLREFWRQWRDAKEQFPDLVMVTDCPFPVEAGFLLRVQRECGMTLQTSPYPIIDVASVLFAVGQDPTEHYDRRANEKPEHNPVCDARQSVRVMLEALLEAVEQ